MHNNERNRPYRNFRTGLDIGMGVLYAIVGFLIFSVKNFMNLDLSAKITLILGSTLIAYGVFRIFRGVMSILRRNN